MDRCEKLQSSTPVFDAFPARTPRARLNYNVVAMTGEAMLIFDLACLIVAGVFSTLVCNYCWVPSLALVPRPGGGGVLQTTLVAAVLAPFILYDKRFGSIASRGQFVTLVRSHALRFISFAAVVWVLGALSQSFGNFPRGWLALWFVSSVLLTSLLRVLVARYMRHLQRRGVLTEVVAVVGAGPIAERLVQMLRQTRPQSIDILGIFDDSTGRAAPGTLAQPSGTLAHLIEIGKTRKIDWILLALPSASEHRMPSVVQRLKALSVPIALCPQQIEFAAPTLPIGYLANTIPVSLLADRPIQRWDAVVEHGDALLPRWIVTLLMLPLMAVEALAPKRAPRRDSPAERGLAGLTLRLDDYDLEAFTDVARRFGQRRYGYVVTPNADHIIRLHKDPAFRACYGSADYILLDSRFVSRLLRIMRGARLPVCTGSDLVATLLSGVVAHDDALVLIGGGAEQADDLRRRYGLRRLAHFSPPMGFIDQPTEVEACLRFIEAHSPFRFCLLAVGSPQQEAIARLLQARGRARGLALCIGASIDFLTGRERRAPKWIQHCGMEWSFRLAQAPRRMAKRYLVRGPAIFALLRSADIVLTSREVPARGLIAAPAPAPAPALALASAHRKPLVHAAARHAGRPNRAGRGNAAVNAPT
jgi:exopolysaccharide biosynthesis WecB/TagA/CpsF family protein